MKWLHVGTRLAILVGFTLLAFYVGRPVYWEALARWQRQAPRIPLSAAGPVHVEIYNPVKLEDEDVEPQVEGEEKVPADVEDDHVSSAPESRLHEHLQKAIWEKPVPGTHFPAIHEFRLRKEMVDFRADKNVIVVTFSNYAFLDFVLNWVKHLTRHGVYNILVGAMDDKILEALFWEGVPVFDMGSKMNTVDVGWGSHAFHKMGREKVFLVNSFLSYGFELLMCDTDMVWLQNPLPYLARFPHADVLTSSDEVVNSVEDDQLEIWDRSWSAYNIGIVHWRPTPEAKAMALEWEQMLVADDKIWDQNGFNDLMRKKGLGPSVDKDSGLFYAYNGTLKLGILPVSIFCSGHTYFVQSLPEKLGLKPYAVHTTFQFGGTPGKRHRLREARVFYDDPTYYMASGGFLTYSPEIPDELLHGGKHTVESHFDLVNYQLVQVRTALAIATVLKRVLVMPKLFCRFDRLWFGHPGVLKNTKTSQPFVCPMDHIFEVNHMLVRLPEEEFGPHVHFREYSFLHNPRLLKELKQSHVRVELCDKGSEECAQKQSKSHTKAVVLPRNSTETELKAVFAPLRNVKILDFSSIDNAFVGFKSKSKQEKFRKRLRTYTGVWCCMEKVDRGHIFYDFFWDTKPDWKPVPPQKAEDDHPPW